MDYFLRAIVNQSLFFFFNTLILSPYDLMPYLFGFPVFSLVPHCYLAGTVRLEQSWLGFGGNCGQKRKKFNDKVIQSFPCSFLQNLCPQGHPWAICLLELLKN